MANKQLLCLDVDGTLLNSQHEITTETKKLITMAVEPGNLIIALVSARPPSGLTFLRDELQIKAPLACYNGAYILDEGNTKISESWIPIETVKKIYQMQKGHGLSCNIYKGTDWYIDQENAWSVQEAEITRSNYQVVNIENLLTQWQEQSTGPNKILVMGESSQISEFNGFMLQKNFSMINTALSKDTYYEIVPANVSKAEAIKSLQAHYKIDLDHVFAIGDNYNDIDMLEYAGFGIAMGNAPEDVKHRAKAVTTTNDQDGVAVAIKKYKIGH